MKKSKSVCNMQCNGKLVEQKHIQENTKLCEIIVGKCSEIEK